MLWKTLILAASVAIAAPAPAAATPRADALAIYAGLSEAVAAGWLTEEEAGRYRTSVRRCRAALPLLPYQQSVELAGVLHDVRLQADRFTRPRALTLFSMLDFNVEYFATHAVPPPKTDARDEEGILYRAFPKHGLQFHPLGNFGKLNAAITANRPERARRHAAALRARGVVPRVGGLVWEYYLPYGGGWPPWRSGMAQAVAAQAFARTSVLLEDPSLLTPARRAFVTVPRRYLMTLSAGPWIRLYSFSSLAVLNSQLQAILSLRNYAALSGDLWAEEVWRQMKRTSTVLLPRFDTGSWSRYALGGGPASTHYHLYVVSLLRELANATGDPVYARYAARFAWYAEQRGVTALSRPELGSADTSDPLSTWGN